MTHSNVTQMSHACHQAQEWIKDLAGRHPFEVEEQAYSYLRAVLHTLRDRLTMEEAVHFAAHLPTLFRGVFYEGWKPTKVPNKMKSLNEFYQHVEGQFGGGMQVRTVDVVAATSAVLAFLEEKVDAGEMRHVKGQLPRELQGLFTSEAA